MGVLDAEFQLPRWCSHVHRRQVDAWQWQLQFFFGGGNEYPIGWKHEENFTSMWLDIHDQYWKARKNDEKVLSCTPRKTYVEAKNWWVCTGFLLSNRGIFRFHLSFRGCINSFWQLFWGPVIFTLRDGHQTSVCEKPRRRCKVSPGLLLQALHLGCSLVWAGIAWGLHFSLVEIGEMKAKIYRSTRILFSPRTLGQWSNLTIFFQMGWNHQLVIDFQTSKISDDFASFQVILGVDGRLFYPCNLGRYGYDDAQFATCFKTSGQLRW